MALTIRSNGSGANNLINASWFNDYRDLLTGAMTDQLVTLKTAVTVRAIGGGPGTAPILALTAGVNMGIGTYQYSVTFVDAAGGETFRGTTASITTTSGNQAVNLTAIPTGPVGTAKRNIYRTAVGGSTFKLIIALNDNTTTTWSDVNGDGSLGAQQPPSHPSFGAFRVQDYNSATKATIFTDGAVSFDGGAITTDGNGKLALKPTSSYDAIGLYATDQTYFTLAGTGDAAYPGGAGAYMWDSKNGGYIYSQGTKNGINFTGSVTGNLFSWGAGSGGSKSTLDYYAPGNVTDVWMPQAGAAQTLVIIGWDGSARKNLFAIGAGYSGALATIDNSGNLSASSLNWGAGVSGHASFIAYDSANRINTYWAPQSGASTQGHLFVVWNGSAQVNLFSIGVGAISGTSGVDGSGNYFGPAGGGIPTTRNGAALSVPIYTGTTTPVNPPTGSIWIKA